MNETRHGDASIQWIGTQTMRPTQGAVGYLEVEFKTQELRARARRPAKLKQYLEGHPIPAVLGPDTHVYLTDHHHMGLALVRLADEWDAGDNPAASNPFRYCAFEIVKDMSQHADMTMQQFFARLEAHQLCHPYDGQGRRVAHIPRYLTDLADDPYRSLAGLARKAGAYEKVKVPYTEFRWADYFRTKVDARLICMDHIAQALQQAVPLAFAQAAQDLPGYLAQESARRVPTLAHITERLRQRFGADDAAPYLPPLPV